MQRQHDNTTDILSERHLLHSFEYVVLSYALADPKDLPLRCLPPHPIFTTAPVIYDLQAVVHHRGTAHQGHYTAFIRDPSGEWCRFNDTKTSTATEAQALSSGAYILSYAKRRGTGAA